MTLSGVLILYTGVNTIYLRVSVMTFLKLAVAVVAIGVLYSVVSRFVHPELPAVVDGYYHPAFEPLARTFRENVESGREPGAAFAVYHKGECVFDMWGGYADPGAERPWRQDTTTMLFSATKGVAAIVIASLVDKKILDYGRPVIDYWPEFGQKDKQNITVEMLVSHQAGLAVLDEPVSIREVGENPKKVEESLASQATTWPAGSGFGYHGVTYGLYVDTLVRKVDPAGRSMQDVFQEDIARPHGIDLFMNTPKEEFHRAARLHLIKPKWRLLIDTILEPRYFSSIGNLILFPDSVFSKSIKSVKEFSNDVSVFNDPAVREVTMSAASGSGTARGLARLYGLLVKDGLQSDNPILNNKSIAKLATALVTGQDVLLGTYAEFGPGTFISNNTKGQPVFGHPGHGGQVGRADPANHLGYGYLTNFISIYGKEDDPRNLALEKAMHTCLQKYKNK